MKNNIIEQFITTYDKAFEANEKAKADIVALNLKLEQLDRDLMEEEMDSALDHLILWDIYCKLADIKEAEAAIQLKIKAIKEAA